MSTNPILEVALSLRICATLLPDDDFRVADCAKKDAAALERLVTDPPAEVVERAADAIVALPNLLSQGARNIARTVLLSLGEQP